MRGAIPRAESILLLIGAVELKNIKHKLFINGILKYTKIKKN